MLALFLMAVESIANSQFFACNRHFKYLYWLIAGFMRMILLVLGPVMIGVFLLWAFGFNHLVAQYRESLLIAAEESSSTMNYVLLFALGAAVAGISFWKMWSFLDPFKQARKCLDDLQATKDNFKKSVCADLNNAQNRYNEISAQIGKPKYPSADDAQTAKLFSAIPSFSRRNKPSPSLL